MQNRTADIEQTLHILLSVKSKKDIRRILARLEQQHGKEGVAEINKMLAKTAENATTELTDLHSLSAIIDSAEAQYPNNPTKQVSTARSGITLFLAKQSKILTEKSDEASTLKKSI